MPPRGARRAALAALLVLAALLAGRAPDGAPAAVAPPGAEAGVLGVGARGPTVAALQRELRSRGFRVAVGWTRGAGTISSSNGTPRGVSVAFNSTGDRSRH